MNWRDPALGVSQTPDSFGGPFEGAAQFVFADGHVTYISNKIDPAVFRALCTPAAGDPAAGREHPFRAWRLKGSSEEPATMRTGDIQPADMETDSQDDA